MTAKKTKQVQKEELTIDNISAGDTLYDLHDEQVEITDDLIEQMRRFEQEMNKKAIYKNKVTGTFLYFKYYEDNPKEVKPKKKPGRKPKAKEEEIEDKVEELDEEELDDELEEIEEAIEKNKLDEAIEVEDDEESLMLDAIEDYKSEFGVKTVKTGSKKFKAFFEDWKKTE